MSGSEKTSEQEHKIEILGEQMQQCELIFCEQIRHFLHKTCN